MEERIVEFVEVLRHNGIKVAQSEANDAVRALAEVGVLSRDLTRATLKATLCKRAYDVAAFDHVFDFFFARASKTLEHIEKSLLKRIEEEGLLGADEIKMIVWMLDRLAGQLAPLTQAALQGDRGKLAGIFRQASLQLDYSRIQSALQTGFYSRRLLSAAGAERMRGDIESVAQELSARGLPAAQVEVVSKHLSGALRQIEEAAREEVQRQTNARLGKHKSAVGDKALHLLSVQEVALAQRSVRLLAEKLKARLLRRERSKKRGQLNPRVTLRKNLASGGVPMVPYFKNRRPQRPDVVVLCDVSASVRNTSRLMLLFTWSLQSLFSKVRSFIFVSELGEVTSHFKNRQPEDALEAALSGDIISLSANSNYGRAFSSFARHSMGAINRKTTVFVIGDGRNNLNAAHVWALEEIKRKAKRVVWICTEPKANWGFGDSEMNNYQRAVSQVVTVLNLADLEKIAPQLVPA